MSALSVLVHNLSHEKLIKNIETPTQREGGAECQRESSQPHSNRDEEGVREVASVDGPSSAESRSNVLEATSSPAANGLDVGAGSGSPPRSSTDDESGGMSDGDLFKEVSEEQGKPLAKFDGTGWEGCDNEDDAITVSARRRICAHPPCFMDRMTYLFSY